MAQNGFSFMDQLLRSFGFPTQFVGWLMTCLTTVTYEICLNGQVIEHFPGKKGLRQGEPVTPYLFVLAMEYLSRIMKTL